MWTLKAAPTLLLPAPSTLSFPPDLLRLPLPPASAVAAPLLLPAPSLLGAAWLAPAGSVGISTWARVSGEGEGDGSVCVGEG